MSRLVGAAMAAMADLQFYAALGLLLVETHLIALMIGSVFFPGRFARKDGE